MALNVIGIENHLFFNDIRHVEIENTFSNDDKCIGIENNFKL